MKLDVFSNKNIPLLPPMDKSPLISNSATVQRKKDSRSPDFITPIKIHNNKKSALTKHKRSSTLGQKYLDNLKFKIVSLCGRILKVNGLKFGQSDRIIIFHYSPFICWILTTYNLLKSSGIYNLWFCQPINNFISFLNYEVKCDIKELYPFYDN